MARLWILACVASVMALTGCTSDKCRVNEDIARGGCNMSIITKARPETPDAVAAAKTICVEVGRREYAACTSGDSPPVPSWTVRAHSDARSEVCSRIAKDLKKAGRETCKDFVAQRGVFAGMAADLGADGRQAICSPTSELGGAFEACYENETSPSSTHLMMELTVPADPNAEVKRLLASLDPKTVIAWTADVNKAFSHRAEQPPKLAVLSIPLSAAGDYLVDVHQYRFPFKADGERNRIECDMPGCLVVFDFENYLSVRNTMGMWYLDNAVLPAFQERARELKTRVSRLDSSRRVEVLFKPERFGGTGWQREAFNTEVEAIVQGGKVDINAVIGRALGYRIVDSSSADGQNRPVMDV